MGQAQNGTGVMAEQMEIHPGRNDVINAAESTFLPRMGKSLLCGISFYSSGCTLEVHPRGKSLVESSGFHIVRLVVCGEPYGVEPQ